MSLVKIFQEVQFFERDAVQALLENLPVEADLAVKVIVDRSDIGARSLGNLCFVYCKLSLNQCFKHCLNICQARN